MTYVISNNLNLKYQRFASTGCTDIGIRKLGSAAKTQFLWENFKPDVNFQLICLTGQRSRTAKRNIKHETL